ncbi:MAG: cardiolipin synthase ClsB [Gallionellaceae bacterium]|nr:cardiolipin synthase ClsB [Gallionellaceae bacterium]
MSSVHEVAEHRLTLLRSGEEYFPRLLATIHAAQHSIYLETYLWAEDETGRHLKEALGSAAARDVSVHVMLDGFGSADFPSAWVREMTRLGVKLLWFRPERTRFRFARQRLRRLHRKLVLIDESVAFVGGINIVEEVLTPRLDYAVEVQGPITVEIAHSMQNLWRLVSWINLRRSGERIHLPHRSTQQAVSFLVRDNFRYRRGIEQAYLRAIEQAQEEIIIANAYFLPGRRFRAHLIRAAQRGVRVTLLLQGKVEYRLQHYATRALYEDLLQAGVQIHEYTHHFLHAKVAVIDSKWATVGSSNIDPFSLLLAREANLVVQDVGFATALHESLLHEIKQNSQAVVCTAWRQRSLWLRVALFLSYALVRLLVGMTGYTHKRDDI